MNFINVVTRHLNSHNVILFITRRNKTVLKQQQNGNILLRATVAVHFLEMF